MTFTYRNVRAADSWLLGLNREDCCVDLLTGMGLCPGAVKCSGLSHTGHTRL